MIKFMNFMKQWEFMRVWMKFPKIRSYMYEFPFAHKIHKFDHDYDRLLIMHENIIHGSFHDPYIMNTFV